MQQINSGPNLSAILRHFVALQSGLKKLNFVEIADESLAN